MVDPESYSLILDKPWFILFYSPKCPHCKKFKPTWTDFHFYHQDEVNVGSIDCLANKKLCHDLYGVEAFPTLRYFPVEETEGQKVSYLFPQGEGRDFDVLEIFSIDGEYEEQEWSLLPREEDLMRRLAKLDLFKDRKDWDKYRAMTWGQLLFITVIVMPLILVLIGILGFGNEILEQIKQLSSRKNEKPAPQGMQMDTMKIV